MAPTVKSAAGFFSGARKQVRLGSPDLLGGNQCAAGRTGGPLVNGAALVDDRHAVHQHVLDAQSAIAAAA